MKEAIDEIKKHLKKKDLIIGSKQVIKNLKLDKIKKVFLASNPPAEVEEDINYYAKLTNTPVIKLDIPNNELGAVCRKQYSIAALAILKEEKK